MAEEMKQVVTIIGISPRSGTNFLKDIICCHPQCAFGQVNGEDYLLYNGDKLLDFIHSVEKRWVPSWGNSVEKLKLELANGIQRFITNDMSPEMTHIVCKTPLTKNLTSYCDIFLNGKLLIIVRDGRDVLESALQTFKGRNMWQHIKLWRQGARDIIRLKNMENAPAYHIVKYEQLVTNVEAETKKICTFLGLDEKTFPYDRLNELPVRGSSQFKNSEGEVSWRTDQRLGRDENAFKFVKKYEDWGWLKRTIFNVMAGKENRALGYE